MIFYKKKCFLTLVDSYTKMCRIKFQETFRMLNHSELNHLCLIIHVENHWSWIIHVETFRMLTFRMLLSLTFLKKVIWEKPKISSDFSKVVYNTNQNPNKNIKLKRLNHINNKEQPWTCVWSMANWRWPTPSFCPAKRDRSWPRSGACSHPSRTGTCASRTTTWWTR